MQVHTSPVGCCRSFGMNCITITNTSIEEYPFSEACSRLAAPDISGLYGTPKFHRRSQKNASWLGS
jgi:hypothetical protein